MMLRNPLGGLSGRTSLPMLTGTHLIIPRRASANHPLPFQVYWLHSWRFGANEVVVPSKGKLAFSCLMGALQAQDYQSGCHDTAQADQSGASILETAEPAAYSSSVRKKTHPPKSEALSNKNAITRSDTARDGVCRYLFNEGLCRDTYGARTHPLRKNPKTEGRGELQLGCPT